MKGHAVLLKQVGPGPAFTYEAYLWKLSTPVQTRWGESVDYIATMRTTTPGLCYAIPAEATGTRLIGWSPIDGVEIYGTHEAVLAKLGFELADKEQAALAQAQAGAGSEGQGEGA